jgi:hypothetical protein
MKKVLFLLGLLSVVGCNLRVQSFVGWPINIRYLPSQSPVCSEFSLTSLNPTLAGSGIELITTRQGIGRIGGIKEDSSTVVPVQIATPNQKTWYETGFSGYSGNAYPIDLEIRCLPGKPAVRKKFNAVVGGDLITISITENSNKPEGIDVDVLLGYSYYDENPRISK